MERASAAPLAGRRVLVTRAAGQETGLVEALEQLGAAVVSLPVIEIRPEDPAELDAALARLSSFAAVCVTSANGVAGLADRLEALRATFPAGTHLIAVGRQTARAAVERGLPAPHMPAEARAAQIPQLLEEMLPPGARVLVVRGSLAGPHLAEALRDAGFAVDDVVIYHTRPAAKDAGPVASMLRARAIDAATFTSPSTVRGLLAALGDAHVLLAPVVRAAIGPVTARALAEVGLPADVVSPEADAGALARALADFIANSTRR